MKIQIFPSDSEWPRLYNRSLCYIVASTSVLTLFWLWDLHYTGVPARGFHDIPRFFDGPAMTAYVLLLVLATRFLQYVHAQPRLKGKFSIRLIDCSRRVFVYCLILGIALASVGDVWLGWDLLFITMWALLYFAYAFVLYWFLALPILLLRWAEARLSRWSGVK